MDYLKSKVLFSYSSWNLKLLFFIVKIINIWRLLVFTSFSKKFLISLLRSCKHSSAIAPKLRCQNVESQWHRDTVSGIGMNWNFVKMNFFLIWVKNRENNHTASFNTTYTTFATIAATLILFSKHNVKNNNLYFITCV